MSPYLSLLSLLGCARVDVNHHAVLPAVGLQRVEATIERGNLAWTGTASAAIVDLDVWSYGSAANTDRAYGIEASNQWGAAVYDGAVAFWSESPAPLAGVDFVAVGPRDVTVDAVVPDGAVELDTVRGDVVVTAGSVRARSIFGSADLYAWSDGIDAVVRPSKGDRIVLHAADGDVFLGLPAGLDYDIKLTAPRSKGVFAEDLLYDSYAGDYGWFEAERGEQTVTVRVVAERGLVSLYEVAAP